MSSQGGQNVIESAQTHIQRSNNDRITWDVLQEVLFLMRDTGQRLEPIGAVCRRWREAYTSTSALWTTIHLFSSISLDLMENLSRLTISARRTAECLVTVDCKDARAWKANAIDRCVQHLIAVIPPQRWQALSLIESSDHVLRGIRPVARQLKSLNTLALSNFNEETRHIIFSIEMPQKLQVLKLQRHYLYEGNDPWIGINLGLLGHLVGEGTQIISRETIPSLGGFQIRRLKLYDPHHMMRVETYPSLQELALFGGFLPRDFRLDIQFPNLERLELVSVIRQPGLTEIGAPSLRQLAVSASGFDMLGIISAPQLDTIILRAGFLGASDPNQDILNAMDMPTYEISPRIVILDLRVEISTLYQLLALSPKLESLTTAIYSSVLSYCINWTDLYRVLSERKDTNPPRWKVCERLTRVIVHLKWTQSIEEGKVTSVAMQGLLKARASGPMQELMVTWTDGSTLISRNPDLYPISMS